MINKWRNIDKLNKQSIFLLLHQQQQINTQKHNKLISVWFLFREIATQTKKKSRRWNIAWIYTFYVHCYCFRFLFVCTHFFQISRKHITNWKLLKYFLIIFEKRIWFRYRFSLEAVGKSYESILENSAGFANPKCIEHLYELVGLDTNLFYSNMSGLRGKYPNEEYSAELRQSQASSWAFR